MRESTKQALAEGVDLIEIEIPTAGLYSVPGDAEGQNEMDYSIGYLHRFCRVFEIMEIADTVRVFFPEEKVFTFYSHFYITLFSYTFGYTFRSHFYGHSFYVGAAQGAGEW